MVLRLILFSSQYLRWHSDYLYTHHSLPIGSDNPYTHTVSLVVLRLYLYSSQSICWPSDYPYSHHNLPGVPGGTLTIPILITDSLVVLRLSLYSSQSLWWPSDYPYTHHNLPGVSDNLYTHHSLPGDTQTIPLLITVSIVEIRLSLYSSQSLWWYADYPYIHHSDSSCWSSVYPYPHHILFCGTQTNPIRIIVSLVVLRIFLYSPQSTWWLRQSLYSSQSLWWYADYPYIHHSDSSCWSSVYPYPHHILFCGTQTNPIRIIVSLVVLRLSLYSSESPW